ncbi:10470_t:CDS:2 [Entrophospora sp. SA101]|nr:8190_t:CDS:2 [Entrophospora sp. SA101]CAJ0645232.1 10470_t:CDS:2 [Entrophospora sp. SA101]CAJ0839988.1 12814_t:CDS:2 [Entrophospora sp. SA101]
MGIESFKELNLKFDSVVAEFKKEKESLININAKLHARVKELEIKDAVGDLEIATEDIGYQCEEKNDARIVKSEQTQNLIISFFRNITLTP